MSSSISQKPTYDPHNKLVTSPFLSPTILASIRLLIASYTLVTIIFVLVWDGVTDHTAGQFFSYFTDLTYTGICAYFWAAGVQGVGYVRRHRSGDIGYPLQKWPRILQVLHLALQASIQTFPLLVTIVFWVLLCSDKTMSTTVLRWRNISVHALNSVFCMFEVLCTNSPAMDWVMLPCMLVILGGYLGLAYITHATQGFYTYSFLDPSKEKPSMLAAYIVGITLAEVIIFALVWGMVKLRERLTRKVEEDGALEPEFEKKIGILG
ncbi:hypothetical protein VNI00_009193 [Paramarasmius palmivorus]|uniref:Uncharacterized protein n=1 Tax=Paramarasmius palmivorus TaxID=297713 RepID=A0AAW0CRX7_9AGAR